MTKDDFIHALSDSVAEEFENIPDEREIEYEFSDGFNKKMKKLLRKRNKFFTKKTKG